MKTKGIGGGNTITGLNFEKERDILDILKKTKLYSDSGPEITGSKVSGFDVELLYVARKLGYKIKEVPVTWVYADESKVHSLKDSYYNAIDVLRVRLNSMKGYYS